MPTTMVKLAGKSPLIRETDVFERTNPIIITLHARHLEIQLKNKAELYALTYRVVLDLARALHARAKIQQRS